MSSNVVNLAAYRDAKAHETAERNPTPEQLAARPYAEVIVWARGDFNRLVAVARARDYRPEWIVHQLEDHGRPMTEPQHALIAQMIAEAGPYLTRRERWVLRQIRAGGSTGLEALTSLAKESVEYRSFKDVARCVANDVAKMVERGLIRKTVMDGEATAKA
jgi:hypothetical protein